LIASRMCLLGCAIGMMALYAIRGKLLLVRTRQFLEHAFEPVVVSEHLLA
jgi:hypothetical protein